MSLACKLNNLNPSYSFLPSLFPEKTLPKKHYLRLKRIIGYRRERTQCDLLGSPWKDSILLKDILNHLLFARDLHATLRHTQTPPHVSKAACAGKSPGTSTQNHTVHLFEAK